MEWYLKVLRQYADFDGRARRKEYWMFVLFNFLLSIGVSAIDYMLGTSFLGMIYSLAVLVPSIAVGVRRLHDIGKSGWMLLVGLIPLVGVIWLLVLFASEGHIGPNQYGEDPKQIEM